MSPRDESEVRLRRLARDLTFDVAAMNDRLAEIDDACMQQGSPTVLAALAVALHHYYTAFESALERTLRFLDGDIPAGPDWHRSLLHEASRPLPGVREAIVSAGTLDDWSELLRFRHFFRHAYSVKLDENRLRALAARAKRLHPIAEADLLRVRDELSAAIEALPGRDD